MLQSTSPPRKSSMDESYLRVKVKSVGFIDAVLTASLMVALVFQSGVPVKQDTEISCKSSVQITVFSPDLQKYLECLAEEGNENNYTGSTKLMVKLKVNGIIPEEDETSWQMQFWGWLLPNMAVGFGVVLVLVASLALARSTSLVF